MSYNSQIDTPYPLPSFGIIQPAQPEEQGRWFDLLTSIPEEPEELSELPFGSEEKIVDEKFE
jgi:hypothetical protein